MAVDPHHSRPNARALPVNGAWLARYIGIPFRDDGLDFSGCHCWGLVHLVLANECGIAVPSYGEYSAADLVTAARAHKPGAPGNAESGDIWRKAQAPCAFDIALMTAMEHAGRLICHVGIMSSPTDVLHIWRATDAVNMPISHPRVRASIVGFYRHRELEMRSAA